MKLFGRKSSEEKVLDLILKHVDIAISTSSRLAEAVQHNLSGNVLKMREAISDVAGSESLADQIKRQIMADLAKGTLPPLFREDILSLVLKLDDAVGWMQSCARILEVISLKDLPKELQDLALEMLAVVSRTVKLTKDCISKLYDDYEEALNLSHAVEESEEEADALLGEVRKALLRYGEIEKNPFYCWMLLDFYGGLERVTDSCEDSVDVVRIIAVRTSGM